MATPGKAGLELQRHMATVGPNELTLGHASLNLLFLNRALMGQAVSVHLQTSW